ncbi:hypothetical protein BJ742DRAFT_465581 [Cladochytrium replicatum]|nr:hypothetical protein BJ742DRAFT_465581 [Cladochytrium replicatum]
MLSQYKWVSFGKCNHWNDTCRHHVAYDDFAVGIVESWNGSPNLVITGRDGYWFNSLDNSTEIMQIRALQLRTLVALSSSNRTLSLVQLRFAKTLTPYQASPVESVPLASPSFNYPIVNASIQQKDPFDHVTCSSLQGADDMYLQIEATRTIESTSSINSTWGEYYQSITLTHSVQKCNRWTYRFYRARVARCDIQKTARI